MIKRIRSKINRHKGNNGVTLVEMLVAMLILSLATTVILGCITLATSQFVAQTRESEAQMLCTTLVTAIQDELLHAEELPAASGNLTKYFSNARGIGGDASLVDDGDRISIKDKYGNLYGLVDNASYVATGRKGNVGSGDFLKASFMDENKVATPPQWDNDKGIVTVKLCIADSMNNVLSYAEFNVKPISP